LANYHQFSDVNLSLKALDYFGLLVLLKISTFSMQEKGGKNIEALNGPG
jgi:hypothetical protein